MQDTVRPNEQAVRAMYTRGYGTWLNIRDQASDNDQLIEDYLSSIKGHIKNAQYFLNIRKSMISTWAATTDTNQVPPFGHRAIVQVVWAKPTQINATLMPGNLKEPRMDVGGREKDHMPILIQSWSYNFNQDSGAPLSTGDSSIEVVLAKLKRMLLKGGVLFYRTMVAGTRLFKARMARSCIFCGL
ncbi:hypothetical protein LB504_003238 [Fusarium proliferatum]|nr:hypothetical protein LB504_003238 [Fusarium proliferatum]